MRLRSIVTVFAFVESFRNPAPPRPQELFLNTLPSIRPETLFRAKPAPAKSLLYPSSTSAQ